MTAARQSDPALRARVTGELPELSGIRSESLREQVIDAWSHALDTEGFRAISELECTLIHNASFYYRRERPHRGRPAWVKACETAMRSTTRDEAPDPR